MIFPLGPVENTGTRSIAFVRPETFVLLSLLDDSLSVRTAEIRRAGVVRGGDQFFQPYGPVPAFEYRVHAQDAYEVLENLRHAFREYLNYQTSTYEHDDRLVIETNYIVFDVPKKLRDGTNRTSRAAIRVVISDSSRGVLVRVRVHVQSRLRSERAFLDDPRADLARSRAELIEMYAPVLLRKK